MDILCLSTYDDCRSVLMAAFLEKYLSPHIEAMTISTMGVAENTVFGRKARDGIPTILKARGAAVRRHKSRSIHMFAPRRFLPYSHILFPTRAEKEVFCFVRQRVGRQKIIVLVEEAGGIPPLHNATLEQYTLLATQVEAAMLGLVGFLLHNE